jgi:hypothetical protein
MTNHLVYRSNNGKADCPPSTHPRFKAMSQRINHRRPIHMIAGKQIESKYADKPIFISTRVLMKAKTWQEIIDHKPKKV